MVQSQGMRNTEYPHHACCLHQAIYGLSTKSYPISCSISALLHLVQTRLSLSIPTALHSSTSWSMLMI